MLGGLVIALVLGVGIAVLLGKVLGGTRSEYGPGTPPSNSVHFWDGPRS